MLKLAPSILAADFNRLGEQISMVEGAGAHYLHIDVMDGSFVPSISFGMPVIASIRKNTKLIFDVHLMIEEPIRYLQDFKDAGADLITVHLEACENLQETITRIKDLGLKAGVSINPATDTHLLKTILKDIDMILVMSVNPGFGGQAFLPNSLQKIRDIKEMLYTDGIEADLEVDGGINLHNVSEVLKAGANVIVSGTSVFSGNIIDNISKFKEVFHTFEMNA